MAKNILQIDPHDNVLVALQSLPQGTTVEWAGDTITLTETIPAKHKFFIRDMAAGDEIFMYGVLVGRLLVPAAKGSRMSTDNTGHAAQPYSWKDPHFEWTAPPIEEFSARTFNGYHRSNGEVGTANYWLFIPTVFCENRNLDVIREVLHNELGYSNTRPYRDFTRLLLDAYKEGEEGREISFDPSAIPVTERPFKNVDGIKFLNHNGGCGGTRQDSDTLGRLLAAYATHPNVGGVTVLSLGCQHLQANQLTEEIHRRDPGFDKPLLVFEQQQSQDEEAMIRHAITQTFAGLAAINKSERKPAPLSKLVVGVKCGGSDGFSGISANPAVGYTADLLVALGGKVLLAEFPELCGAEQDILDRCNDENSASRFINLMETYDAQARQAGSGFYMNPSPGNIRDGLITDAIKSAGAAKKAGSSPVVDVLDYTEPATRAGLSLVCTPGNDVEATTGKAAAGATLILFTTGLGTPTGNPVTPVIKVSSNTTLAKKMPGIIDINTGDIIEGTSTIEEKGREILEYCIRVASGETIPKAVTLNQDDFIPWKRGVSL
ncbi:MAG: altronate dehydratase [Chitinophagaceae bacterium]|nr:MAG: altronate dehydratase [Chitinophagaceae bacterium]